MWLLLYQTYDQTDNSVCLCIIIIIYLTLISAQVLQQT